MVCSSCGKAKYKYTKTLEGTYCDICIFNKQNGDIVMQGAQPNSRGIVNPRLDNVLTPEEWKEVAKACKAKS